MKPVSLTALKRAKHLPPILLIFGEERFLVEESLQQFLQELSRRGIDPRHIEYLHCDEISPEQLLSRLMAYPLLSTQRVLVLRNAEKLSKLQKRAEGKQLLQLLEQPLPQNTLIFVASLPNLDGLSRQVSKPRHQATVAKKLQKAPFPFRILLEKHLWIEHPKLYPEEIPSWIGQYLSRYGKTIAPEALQLLLDYTGPSLATIHNELEKLLLYVADRKKITAQDVATLAGFARQYTIFDLQAAIGKRQLRTALHILNTLLTTQRQELLILTMLTRYFLILHKLSQLRTREPATLSKITGINIFFIPEYVAALEHFSEQELLKALEILHTADATLKTSSAPAISILQEALIKILSPTKVLQ